MKPGFLEVTLDTRSSNGRADALAREERERVDRANHFTLLHDSNKENVERLIDLTEKHQSLTVEAAKIDMRVSHAIHSLETAIQKLALANK